MSPKGLGHIRKGICNDWHFGMDIFLIIHRRYRSRTKMFAYRVIATVLSLTALCASVHSVGIDLSGLSVGSHSGTDSSHAAANEHSIVWAVNDKRAAANTVTETSTITQTVTSTATSTTTERVTATVTRTATATTTTTTTSTATSTTVLRTTTNPVTTSTVTTTAFRTVTDTETGTRTSTTTSTDIETGTVDTLTVNPRRARATGVAL
ncbi:hypothetical protein OH77DRAFT_1509500 [Trametes cingulata]|nr:hypothetical protein OH77DRAFT_1509500 [Trametes cingulata]